MDTHTEDTTTKKVQTEETPVVKTEVTQELTFVAPETTKAQNLVMDL